MNDILHQKEYAELLQNVKKRIVSAQSAINKELIDFYLDIQEKIKERNTPK